MAEGDGQNGKRPVIEPGYGPPKGSAFDSPWAQPIPAEQLRGVIEQRVGAGGIPTRNDPGFQPPSEPLDDATRSRVQLVYRDVPLVTIQNAWTVQDIRTALWSHMQGIFELSGQLMDSILGDDRVQATLGSRVSGLFGREVRHQAPKFRDKGKQKAADECLRAWKRHWPALAESYALPLSHVYAIFMGFTHGQMVWDTAGSIWKPYARPWHPRYEFYEWSTRKYVAISQDGNLPILPGDGKWYEHTPYGSYRGWVRGAVRAVAEPWALRHFGFRDFGNYSEVHGLPTRIAEAPAASDPGERAQFEQQVSQLGARTTLLIGKGIDKEHSYDYRLVEPHGAGWEVHPALIDRADMAIVLSLLFQNLTTEVKGGSFAATTAHMDIRQSGIQADNAGWKQTIRRDFARPFAYLNFGDPSLAPWTWYDVESLDRYEHNAKAFQQFGTAIEVLRRGGVQFKDVEELRRYAADRFGIAGLPDFEITEPVAGGIGK